MYTETDSHGAKVGIILVTYDEKENDFDKILIKDRMPIIKRIVLKDTEYLELKHVDNIFETKERKEFNIIANLATNITNETIDEINNKDMMYLDLLMRREGNNNIRITNNRQRITKILLAISNYVTVKCKKYKMKVDDSMRHPPKWVDLLPYDQKEYILLDNNNNVNNTPKIQFCCWFCPMKDDFSKYAEKDITHMVSIMGSDEKPLIEIKKIADKYGIVWKNIDIVGVGSRMFEPSSEKNMIENVRYLNDIALKHKNEKKEFKLYLHCRGGGMRTEVFTYLLLRSLGNDAHASIIKLRITKRCIKNYRGAHMIDMAETIYRRNFWPGAMDLIKQPKINYSTNDDYQNEDEDEDENKEKSPKTNNINNDNNTDECDEHDKCVSRKIDRKKKVIKLKAEIVKLKEEITEYKKLLKEHKSNNEIVDIENKYINSTEDDELVNDIFEEQQICEKSNSNNEELWTCLGCNKREKEMLNNYRVFYKCDAKKYVCITCWDSNDSHADWGLVFALQHKCESNI